MTTLRAPAGIFPTLRVERWARLAALGLLLWLYFWHLQDGSLSDFDECLTAERSREFFLGAPWHTPYFNGQPDFNKPPLLYWMTALSMRVAGFGEGVARFWPAIFGWISIALTALMAARLGRDKLAGWIAFFVLALCPEWLYWTRQAIPASGAICAMLAAAWFLLRRPASMRAAWLAGAAAAAGALMKGPFTPLIFLYPLGRAFASRSQKSRRLRIAAAGLCIALALAAPWFIFELAHWGRPYYDAYFSRNLAQRVTQSVAKHTLPPLGYFVRWGTRAPFLAVATLGALLLSWAAPRRARRRALEPALVAAIILILLLCMRTRIETYLLNVYPFAAMAAAIVWAGLARRLTLPEARRACGVALGIAAALFCLQYSSVMEFAPRFKKFARLVEKEKPHPAGLFAVGYPPNVLIYYGRPGWRKIAAPDIEASAAKAFEDGAEAAYFVVSRKSVSNCTELGKGTLEWSVVNREDLYALLKARRASP